MPTPSQTWRDNDNQVTGEDARPPAVELQSLRKTFGSFVAIDGLTLTIQEGEIFGLLGPNGSGKTTIVNMMSALLPPNAGRVLIFGKNITHDPQSVRAVLGTVPQETALYEELSAWHNMVFHAELYGVPPRERKQRISTLLDLVQLGDRLKSRVSTFSGGMKRRLALARALLHDPLLLYLDEPTLGVDVQSRNAIWNYILELKQQGKTIVLTTNYLEEANALCDRLAIIDKGKLIVLDTADHLKETYGSTILDLTTEHKLSPALLKQLATLAGVKNMTQDGQTLKLVVRGKEFTVSTIINLITHESELTSFTQREPNLDEVFLSLTGSELRD